jgi:arylsulfatase A-like enzyme
MKLTQRVVLGLLLLAAGRAASAAAPGGHRFNFLFITSDDHRWDDLGAAGNPNVHTPVLDRLAREGIYLRQATIHVSQCLPSRATLLTGLPPHLHGAWSHETQSPEANRPDAWAGLPTLPGLLAQAGYRTVVVGKWHVAADPWRVGFSDVRTWLPEGGTLYKDPELARGKSREETKIPGYTQTIFADDAIAFLGSAEAKAQPFFLWLAFTAPHTPFAPNPPEIEKLYAGKPLDALLPPGFPRGIPVNDWHHYAEATSALDEQVGRVLAALDRAGLTGETIVVFLGDNGFMMGEHGVGAEGPQGKVVPFESSLRVPLLIRDPRLAAFSGTSDLPVSSLDLPPTLLAMAGLPAPSSWPGRDLLPALRREPGAKIEEAFSEWAAEIGPRFGPLAYRAVRTPRAKLIVWRDPAKPDELYDLAADPEEKVNLADRPESQALRSDLAARLRAWMEKTADPALRWPRFTAPAPPPK